MFEAASLPDDQKEELCRSLLAEFGVTSIATTVSGELIHSCCLPFGSHRNGDKNPSASLNYRKLTYNCLGCGSAGGLLWFIAVCRGEDSHEARQWLNNQTGTGNTVMELSALLTILDQIYAKSSSVRPPMPRYHPSALKPWTWQAQHPYLTSGAPEHGVEGRHIPEETLWHFGIGYAPEYYDGSERIIIPLWWEGDLVGWQARRIDAAGYSDKYRNSPDFPKDRTLYNYSSKHPKGILVESPASVLRHYHHQNTLEATFGAKVTDAQIKLLHRHAEGVILWFDNDNAGWEATCHVGEALQPYVPVWTVESPWAADPADLPDDLVDHLIDQAVPWSVWSPPTTLKQWSNDVDAEILSR